MQRQAPKLGGGNATLGDGRIEHPVRAPQKLDSQAGRRTQRWWQLTCQQPEAGNCCQESMSNDEHHPILTEMWPPLLSVLFMCAL